MSSFSVKVNDQPVRAAMAQLLAKSQDQRVAMTDIGEALKIYIDTRFATQSGPNGQKWLSDSLLTIEAFIKARGGYSAKTGRLNKKGVALTANKKVLQGLTGELRRTIYWQAFQNSLVVASPKPYAAIHQFGGPFKAWGKQTLQMPARPFMPIDQNGNLSPAAQKIVLGRLRVHLNAKT